MIPSLALALARDLIRVLFRSRTAVIAENLFHRRQLALYPERKIRRSSAPIGQVGQPLETGTKKRTTKNFTYEFTAGGKVYVAQAEKKPVEGLEKGATIKIAVQKETIYVQAIHTCNPYGIDAHSLGAAPP